MEVQQRFLRRKHLIESTEILLRESIYHRTHEVSEDLDGIVVWRWDDEEGTSEDPI